MKNLPDKIYLATTEEIQNLDNTFVGIAHSDPEDIIEPIEYIRKDVFVKKAVEHIDGLIEFLNEFGHQLKKERIIEDFKKHIES